MSICTVLTVVLLVQTAVLASKTTFNERLMEFQGAEHFAKSI